MVEIDAQKTMSLSLSLLFYIKKSKADSTGKTNIYLRITLDGHRSEFSIHRKIRVDWWNSRTQSAMGNSPESQNINKHLSILKNKVYSIQQNFERESDSDIVFCASISTNVLKNIEFNINLNRLL
ncbi:MAG TPA: hypothetical protein ENH91_11975, partial [Leeuwenhoekiella sp.]|nr:hypothetical protein [Leeuwenhoekiella sp.]